MMRFTAAMLLAATCLGGAAASATTYTGLDNGASVGGSMPNSDAAATSFLAAAAGYGAVNTIDFDSSPTGYASSYNFPGVTITLAGANYGSNFSGIVATNNGNLYGYDVSAGGTGNWLGFPSGAATFTFDTATNAFGFYLTGTQSSFGTTINVTIDGVDYMAPINDGTGGAAYFGYTSDTAFSSVKIADNLTGDAWGIDNVSFSAASSDVPEAATWAMFIGGFGLVGMAMRRRRTSVAFG